MAIQSDEVMHSCTKCGYSYKQSSLFCPNCGTRKAVVIKPKNNVCDFCGTACTDEQKFCTGCGRPLRALVLCEHCAKNGISIALVEGARYCCKCGGEVTPRTIDFRAYQYQVMQKQPLSSEDCFAARVIGSYGHGFGTGIYPLMAWNNQLITINSGTIYIYNLLAARQGDNVLRPFCFAGGEFPKVSCVQGIERHKGTKYPALFRIVNGILVVPGFDRIFLWDIAGNVMKRATEDRCGGRKGLELELNGQLAADIAGDGEHFLAALVRNDTGLHLHVYEFRGATHNVYYTWPLGEREDQIFTVYVTAHYVYVLAQNDPAEGGDLLCFSLDTYRAVELDNLRGVCRPLVNFDNTSELIQVERESGYVDIMRLHPEQAAPVLLLDKVVLPQCYSRDGQAFWIVGRSLLFADGQNNFSVVAKLDENMMRMGVSPVRSPYGLCFIDDRGLLCTIRQENQYLPYKLKLEVRLNGREVRLNRLSPWIAAGNSLYGFSDEGLIAIDMNTVYLLPQSQDGNGEADR